MTKLCDVAFSGSGLLFPIHMGAYAALREKNPDCIPDSFSGTSGGSIVAALAAMGLSADAMFEKLKLFDLSKMIEFNPRAMFSLGYCDGKKVERALGQVFGNRLIGDLDTDLHITASDVNTGSAVVFSTLRTPHVRIRDAIRASISIPFVFVPKKIDKWVLVDGMLFNNIPFSVFSGDKPIYGFHLQSYQDKQFLREDRSLPSYAMRIFDMVCTGLNRAHISLSELYPNTDLYIIDAGKYNPLESYPYEDLYRMGYNAVSTGVGVRVA